MKHIILNIVKILAIYFIFTPISHAKIVGGSLEFMKSKPISIRRQDLTLSLDKITTNYVLINNSGLELIETLVFPAPYYPNIKEDKFKEQQFEQLKIIVDGRTIEYKTISRPISLIGEDLTDLFKSLSIPSDPIEVSAIIRTFANGPQIKNVLLEKNLIDHKTNAPLWINRVYYYWNQKFIPAQEVHITQSHSPIVRTFNRDIQYKTQSKKSKIKISKTEELNNLKNSLISAYPNITNFCMNNSDFSGLLTTLQESQAPLNKGLTIRNLEYNLVNNNSWSSAIDYFTLRIEYPEDMTPVFCWPKKFERINSSAMLFSAQNYEPSQNMSILFLGYE